MLLFIAATALKPCDQVVKAVEGQTTFVQRLNESVRPHLEKLPESVKETYLKIQETPNPTDQVIRALHISYLISYGKNPNEPFEIGQTDDYTDSYIGNFKQFNTGKMFSFDQFQAFFHQWTWSGWLAEITVKNKSVLRALHIVKFSEYFGLRAKKEQSTKDFLEV